MKVKSFFTGLAGGVAEAFQRLDQFVAEGVGDAEIHSITDTPYLTEMSFAGPSPGPSIVRVVVYTPSPTK